MKTTLYSLKKSGIRKKLRIAIAADLHNNPFEKVVAELRAQAPDIILIPGDLMDDFELRDPNARGYEFLRICVGIAPTYYSVGNHEIGCYHRGNPWRKPIPNPLDAESTERIKATGAIFLDNESVTVDGVTFCGLTSGINRGDNFPSEEVLQRFADQQGFRILLCHHPEYYHPYVKKTDIDLIVSGHAHGGHWRIFGRGVYSPGQGLFPKYTSGILEERCIISRGLGNHTKIPRIFNPPELIVLTLSPN